MTQRPLIAWDSVRCTKCGAWKPPSDFYVRSNGRLSRDCKACRRQASRANYAANPAAMREYDYRRKFGIGIADYDRILAAQGETCAICEVPTPGGRAAVKHFHVDHCHQCGGVRGLLCHHCNLVLGHVEPAVRRALLTIGGPMADYLNQHQCEASC